MQRNCAQFRAARIELELYQRTDRHRQCEHALHGPKNSPSSLDCAQSPPAPLQPSHRPQQHPIEQQQRRQDAHSQQRRRELGRGLQPPRAALWRCPAGPHHRPGLAHRPYRWETVGRAGWRGVQAALLCSSDMPSCVGGVASRSVQTHPINGAPWVVGVPRIARRQPPTNWAATGPPPRAGAARWRCRRPYTCHPRPSWPSPALHCAVLQAPPRAGALIPPTPALQHTHTSP